MPHPQPPNASPHFDPGEQVFDPIELEAAILLGLKGAFFLLIPHLVQTPEPRVMVGVGVDAERVATCVAQLAADEARIHLVFPVAERRPSAGLPE